MLAWINARSVALSRTICGIIDGVGRIRNGMDHFGQVGRAADGLQVATAAQPLQEQRGVDPQALVVHGQQMGAELLVGVGVEIGRPQHQCHVVAQIGVQQQAAEHAFFGVEVLRGQAVEDFRTDGGSGAARVSAISSSHGKKPPDCDAGALSAGNESGNVVLAVS